MTDRAQRSGGKRAMRPPQALLLDNTESVAAPTPCSSTSSDVEEAGLWGLPSPVWKKARVQGESTVPNNSPPSSTRKVGLLSVQSPGSEPSRESPSPPPQDDLTRTPLPKQHEQRQSTGSLKVNGHGHGHKYEHKHEPKKDQTPVNIHIELLNDKDDNDDNDNEAQEDNCCQGVDEDGHRDESSNQAPDWDWDWDWE
ncbi:hypothetical protein BG003_011649 [Podila horticola]|nr:hypothetical protein BG003_011649 [Podila horticola]